MYSMEGLSNIELWENGTNCMEVIDSMYKYIKEYAIENNLTETLKALPYARSEHEGQFRKGKNNIPYIYHPLVICVQAISLGLCKDEILATALLHDVCEDCGKTKEELPVTKEIQDAVGLLTKEISLYSKEVSVETRYYEDIATNRWACIVKLLDRCNNISDMVFAFSKEKMIDYIESTEYFVYPLFEIIDSQYSEYSRQIYAIRYHMSSVIKAIKIFLR